MAKVWHYKNEEGIDEICKWALSLQTPQLARLQAKVKMLEDHGSDLIPNLLTESGEPHIKKLRVRGNVQLRPLLCRITDDGEPEEFVLLIGAVEVQSQYEPRNARAIAAERRLEVLKDESRKTPHVKFTKCRRR